MRDIREKDWFWLENDVVDRTDLEPMERLLYMVLARHSDNRSGESFPSEDTLCKKTGIKDKRTIRKYIGNLENKGLISIKRQLGKSNRYFLKSVKVVATNDTSFREVDTRNVVAKDDTGKKKPVAFDAQTSNIECHSNYTHNKTNIMNHEEHDFFEKLFSEIEIKFTKTNQQSVKKLLESLTRDDVKSYLLETYTNLKNNPQIKNISGVFTKKIAKGERQPVYKEKIVQEKKESQEEVVLTPEKKIQKKEEILTLDLIAKEKAENEKLDLIFESLSKTQQKNLMEKAFKIALAKSNGFVPFAKLAASTKIKYELLKEIQALGAEIC